MCYRHAKWENAWRESRQHTGWGARAGHFPGRSQSGPPANVQETDDSFEIFLAAPGRDKTDFSLSIADDVLTIRSARSEENGEGRWLRNEYRLAAFERRFQLSSKVEADLITARYADGILQVTLPKRPEFAGPAQEIAVA